jgi:hypothetical protein
MHYINPQPLRVLIVIVDEKTISSIIAHNDVGCSIAVSFRDIAW